MYLIHKYRVVRLLAKPRLPLLAKPLSGSLSGIHIETKVLFKTRAIFIGGPFNDHTPLSPRSIAPT